MLESIILSPGPKEAIQAVRLRSSPPSAIQVLLISHDYRWFNLSVCFKHFLDRQTREKNGITGMDA